MEAWGKERVRLQKEAHLEAVSVLEMLVESE